MAFYTTVRYGKMRMVARCRVDRDDVRARDNCIVKTDRGKEFGTVLSPLQKLEDGASREGMFPIIRKASEDDGKTADRLEKENRNKARALCKDEIKRLKLDMKLVEVDYLFGGERIIFYFTSESRVDFRELVRMLAREFRTRVELRQIGGRDEARLVGDVGHCGLSLCCRGLLKELGGISMEMAKIQKHTSDPSKITGRCGKLLCCLRYEFSAYKEARDELPPRGKWIKTRKGEGKVVDQNLLMREITIQPEGGQRTVIKLDEIVGVADEQVSGCNGCGDSKGGSQEKGDAGRSVATAQPEPDLSDTTKRKLEEETRIRPPVQFGEKPEGETPMGDKPASPPPRAGTPPAGGEKPRRRRGRRGRGGRGRQNN